MLGVIASISGIIGFILYIVEKLYGPKKLKDVLVWGGLGLIVTIPAWKLYIGPFWQLISYSLTINKYTVSSWVHWSLFGALYTSIALAILDKTIKHKILKDKKINNKIAMHLTHTLIGMIIWLGIFYIFSSVALEIVLESRTQIKAETFISGTGGMALGIYIGLRNSPRLKRKSWRFF